MTAPVILPSPEIWNRDDFPALCFWRKLYRCVEVGVDRGVWARLFLDRYPQIREWWGVDNWAPYPEMPFNREGDFLAAAQAIAPYHAKAKLIRGVSWEVAKIFPRDSVDFVYIDGAHDYESVMADILAWWPALSKEGVLAGHDWTDEPVHEGVKGAVAEFAAANDLTIYLTTVEGYHQEKCPSWMIYKSGLPGADWRRC